MIWYWFPAVYAMRWFCLSPLHTYRKLLNKYIPTVILLPLSSQHQHYQVQKNLNLLFFISERFSLAQVLDQWRHIEKLKCGRIVHLNWFSSWDSLIRLMDNLQRRASFATMTQGVHWRKVRYKLSTRKYFSWPALKSAVVQKVSEALNFARVLWSSDGRFLRDIFKI